MSVKGKLGAVRGRKYLKRISLDRLDRIKILRKGDTTSAGNCKFETTKFGYNMYRGWTQTDYQNKHYNINQKDEGT